MQLVTSAEMRAIEDRVIHHIGISSLVLMENAGRAIVEEALEFIHHKQGFRWLILVGKGNNGGDGLVCARLLMNMGCHVHILYAVSPIELQGDAAVQRDIVMQLNIPYSIYQSDQAADDVWDRCDGIIDSLLGTGISGEPREPFASLIHKTNNSKLPIVSADLPSGLHADTGVVPVACIKADLTVTLAYCKRGLLLYPGADAAGKVVNRSIGFPEHHDQLPSVDTYIINEETLKSHFNTVFPMSRAADTHKGTYGHVLAIAGSIQMSGAGWLCCKAALRAGSGLVTWGVPELLADRLIGILPEVMLHRYTDQGSGSWQDTKLEELLQTLNGKQALIVGPGLGRWKGDSEWLRNLWVRSSVPIIADADALNMMADTIHELSDSSAWPKRSALVILTPHPGEMARLCGITTAEVQNDRIGAAIRLAKQLNAIIVLKGARTVVAAPNGEAFVNTTGNPGMSTGGAGDVLAGVIGSLVGQGLDPLLAAVYGVYWHGLAGDQAVHARSSSATIIASDMIEHL